MTRSAYPSGTRFSQSSGAVSKEQLEWGLIRSLQRESKMPDNTIKSAFRTKNLALKGKLKGALTEEVPDIIPLGDLTAMRQRLTSYVDSINSGASEASVAKDTATAANAPENVIEGQSAVVEAGEATAPVETQPEEVPTVKTVGASVDFPDYTPEEDSGGTETVSSEASIQDLF